MEREAVNEALKWDLTPLFKDVASWHQLKTLLDVLIGNLKSYEGTLGQSAGQLYTFMQNDDMVCRWLSRLYLYASLLSDEDVGNAANQALVKEAEQRDIDYEQATSWVQPELAGLDDETIDRYCEQEPHLRQYRMTFDRIRRRRPHILGLDEERLLSLTALLGDTPQTAFNIFSDAEMPKPVVTLSDGRQVQLDHTEFSRQRASAVRDDRKLCYEAFWDNYKHYEGTFGELLNGNVRRRLFGAKARKFGSTLEAALLHNDIPEGVYTGLIENVHRALPTFHRYLRVKARLLGVEELHYYDLYAPPAASLERQYTWEEARTLVDEALRPLGEEYRSIVGQAFEQRWIDAMPSEGKANGAYSNGGAYDVHPYILMNFNGRYDSVSTLIHELGHTMHSYLTNRAQPYATHSYATFVAEVASTFNEALLDEMMLGRLTEPSERLALLMNMLDGFKGTLFRQTQFAEFQLRVHQMAQEGKPITGAGLSELYLSITRKYYGHTEGACVVDEPTAIEWAFIPHFYMGYYVYQYSTSFVASQALSAQVLAGEAGALERYKRLLMSGDSDYPIALLRAAGVDMLSPLPFETTITKMNRLLDMVEELGDRV